jgi:hypothetical protein
MMYGCWGAGARARRCDGRSCACVGRRNHALDMQWQVGSPDRGCGGVGGRAGGGGVQYARLLRMLGGLRTGRVAAMDAAAPTRAPAPSLCTCTGKWALQWEGLDTACHSARG